MAKSTKLLSKEQQLALARSAGEGDSDAVADLYNYADPYARAMLKRKGYFLRVEEMIEDALQDAWTSIIENLRTRSDWYDGRLDFALILLRRVEWSIWKQFGLVKRRRSLDETDEEGKPAFPEPSYIDESYEESFLYGRFDQAFKSLSRAERRDFLEERISNPRFKQVKAKLRAALLGEKFEESKLPMVDHRDIALTKSQVNEIRKRLVKKEDANKLAKEFRLTRAALYTILVGTFRCPLAVRD